MTPLLAVVLVCAVCGLLSCWLVLLGWSLMGDAVSHAVLPGVVLASLWGLPYALGALVFAFIAVGLIGAVRSTGRLREDAAIGVVFTSLFALGLALISATGASADLDGVIFGEVLDLTPAQLVQTAVLCVVVATVLLVGRRVFTLYAFDPTQAFALGVRPRLVGGVLLAMLALTAVVALQVVGVVLVVAMLIVPGATAIQLTRRFGLMLVLAPTLAVASGVAGVVVAQRVGAEPGAVVVLAQALVFAVVTLARWRRPSAATAAAGVSTSGSG